MTEVSKHPVIEKLEEIYGDILSGHTDLAVSQDSQKRRIQFEQITDQVYQLSRHMYVNNKPVEDVQIQFTIDRRDLMILHFYAANEFANRAHNSPIKHFFLDDLVDTVRQSDNPIIFQKREDVPKRNTLQEKLENAKQIQSKNKNIPRPKERGDAFDRQ